MITIPEKLRHPYFLISLFHSGLFLTLLVMAFTFFNTNLLSSLWAAQSSDSAKFIANTLNLTPPPYPYHPIATSLHYFFFFVIFSVIFPENLAITFAVLLIQFTASLLALGLLYQQFIDTFHLTSRNSLILTAFYDFIFISPFLLLATAEVLFLFYQVLTWMLIVRKYYTFAAITTAMTFALRFNGAFFVIGVLLIAGNSWWKNRSFSLGLIARGIATGIVMFLVGFSSFIWSLYFNGDFWLPLTFQYEVFQMWGGYIGNKVASLPFLWWPIYIQWVLDSNSPLELIFLVNSFIILLLGLISLTMLIVNIKKSNDPGDESWLNLTLLYFCGFLGNNIIVAGRNFPRFLSYTFPVFPVFPIMLRNHNLTSICQIVVVLGSGLIGLLMNTGWWMSFNI